MDKLTIREKALLRYVLALMDKDAYDTVESSLVEIDGLLEQRVADIENALCELDGGNNNE